MVHLQYVAMMERCMKHFDAADGPSAPPPASPPHYLLEGRYWLMESEWDTPNPAKIADYRGSLNADESSKFPGVLGLVGLAYLQLG
jgi:hypothetical protein